MIVIPAIDLKEGRCVRLRQGDMGQETLYSHDPAAMASHWEQLGAQCLHVVDLNGAIEGRPENYDQIAAIVKTISIPVQVGGGIRSVETVRKFLSLGVSKVILGTAALEDPDLLAQSCQEFPGRVLVGIDVKQGKVAVHGWTNLSFASPAQVFRSLAPFSISGVVFTEISRDGMLGGPDLEALGEAVASSPFPLIASGGITRERDIHAVRELGPKIIGVIIGKALYEGTLDLPAAVRAAGSEVPENRIC